MDEAIASESKAGKMINMARGLVGAVLGGAAGYFVTGWLLRHGLYAMALPGVGLGFGAGLLARKRCMRLAIVCGLLALALELFTVWKHILLPEDSLGYFLRHLADLRPVTLIMIGLGTLAGFWFALGSSGRR